MQSPSPHARRLSSGTGDCGRGKRARLLPLNRAGEEPPVGQEQSERGNGGSDQVPGGGPGAEGGQPQIQERYDPEGVPGPLLASPEGGKR